MFGLGKERSSRSSGVPIFVGEFSTVPSRGVKIIPIPHSGTESGLIFRTKEYEVVGQTAGADGILNQETLVQGRFRNNEKAIEAARKVLRNRKGK